MAEKIRYPWETPPPAGEAIEVAEGILWMRLPLPMALDHVNVYALRGPDGWDVIDTGFDSRTTRKLWDDLLAGPMAGLPVARIICTHHHPDHMGLAGWFHEKGAELVMPRTPYLMARMLQLDVQESYTDTAVEFYRRAGMRSDILEERQKERPFNFADCTTPLPLGFTRLEEGETIDMAGRCWQVRMGNGHAPEHATFWSLDDDLVIAGDQLLPSISPNIGVYPTQPDADPLGEWLASCDAFEAVAEDRHFVLPGHKLPFTGLPFRMRQLRDNHVHALDRLLEAIATPQRAGDVFLPIFKREIDGGAYGLALVEALAHMNHLHQTGRATRTLGEDGAYWFQAT
ncbi:MAG: MBL fold metallo-hydrolase [Pseudomonadota bacterium]